MCVYQSRLAINSQKNINIAQVTRSHYLPKCSFMNIKLLVHIILGSLVSHADVDAVAMEALQTQVLPFAGSLPAEEDVLQDLPPKIIQD